MVNKYWLYIIVVFGVFLVLMGGKLVHLITYKTAKGRIAGYEEEWVSNSRGGGYTKRYPKVMFYTPQYEVTILAPSFMYEASEDMSSVTVYYSPKKPTNAFVYNFYGFWGTAMIYFLPFFLVATICTFSPNFIPKFINFRLLERKLFE